MFGRSVSVVTFEVPPKVMVKSVPESFILPPLSPQIKYFLSASNALVFAVFVVAIVPNPIVKLEFVLTLLDCF